MTDHNAFALITTQTIDDINSTARLYRHKKTGAEILSLENDDENKTFGITFRTPPSDSTGLPHIMEHSVLCGSRKYPLKEPFVELLKGSLKTFLNAFTYPDKTCYPVASQNTQDFYNLIDVYLDAVFFPRLTPHILEQEGWHYELDNLDESIIYKGVVFNEMKGVYSSPDSVLGRYIQQSLFPDITYGVDSGGDPGEIPNLTFEQFQNFHQTYYHPANARIFFYGDDDPAQRLGLIEPFLAEFEPQEFDSSVPLQSLFSEPQHLSQTYAVSQEDDPANSKGYLAVSWLMPEITSLERRMSLQILSYILVGTSASPLRKALIDSGLGEDVTGGGMAAHLRQMFFSTGLKGIDPTTATQVEDLILNTLQEVAQQGIDPDMIEAAINTTEFSLRENNTGSFPRGLSLMLRSLGTWLYDQDPLEPLALEAPLAAIKADIAANPRFFETLMKEYLLQNNHRVTLTLNPDPALQQQQEAAEKERLAQVEAKMDETARQAVIDNTQALKLRQETPDPPAALAKLPGLQLSDLDKKNKSIPLEIVKIGENDILYHDLFTNGILYLDVGFNMQVIPTDLLPYFPLFSNALLRVGTAAEDFVKLSQRIGRKTGGVWTASLTSSLKEQPGSVAWFLLRSKATMSQIDDLLALLRDVLLTVQLDNKERIKQLVLESKARREAGLIPGGHSVVDTRLRARFNEADWLDEQLGGISQLFFTRQLVQEIENDWPGVLAKLETLRTLLLNRNALFCNVTLDQANWQQVQPKLTEFIATLPDSPVTLQAWTPQPLPANEGLTIPAQVNYVGKGTNLYDLGYKKHGSISVITNFLRTSWLWERVRVQGGAYGGFCLFDQHSGVLTFLSYRDPNLLGTLQNYDDTSTFLRDLDLSDDEVTKSIIGAIGKMDHYQLPDAKGYSSMVRHLIGLTDEQRQQHREEILATSVADFKAFADILAEVNKAGNVVVLGSQEAIAAANDEQGEGWLAVQQVL